MKAQQNHPPLRSIVVAKRRTPPAIREAAATPARRVPRHQAEQEQGTRLLWLLLIIGALVAAGFIFALRSQHTVHELGQAEAQLRNDLDRISLYQRHLALEQQRALSVRESEQMAKQSGLIQPKLPTAPLTPRATTRADIVAKPAATTVQLEAAPLLAKPPTARPHANLAKVPVPPALTRLSARPAPAKLAVKSLSAIPAAKKQNQHQPLPARLAQRR